MTLLAGEIQQAEIVILNIGGRLLQTELSTLTAVPSSHLAQLARHWQSYPQQTIFLDRNPRASLLNNCQPKYDNVTQQKLVLQVDVR